MNKLNKSIIAVTTIVAASLTSCASPGKRTAIGAGGGAAAGAAIGGAAAGWKGAGLGALAGAASGAAIGNYLDKQAQELEKVADTKRVKDGILVNLKNDLLFETNSAVLKGPAVDQLTQLAQVLVKYPEDRIRIAGYTDSVGSETYNEGLSYKRANAVRDVLMSQGVREDQIFSKGFGEMSPVSDNSTASGRLKNRRVEVLIDIPKDRAPAAEAKVKTK